MKRLEFLKNPQNIKESITHLLKYLESISKSNSSDENTFLSSFHTLLFQIFGFAEDKKCWLIESLENHEIQKTFFSLLDPYGLLFDMILKYADPFYNYVLRFQFPKAKLPYGTLFIKSDVNVMEGTNPYYITKLKNSNEDNIFLDIFEYFFFLFSSFVLYNKYDFKCKFQTKNILSPIKWINKRMASSSRSKGKGRDGGKNKKGKIRNKSKSFIALQQEIEQGYHDSYRNLLQKYLNFFFKRRHMKDHPAQIKAKYLKIFGTSFFNELSEKFLQILVDFYLNQSVKTQDGNKFNPVFLKNPRGIILSVTVLVRHLLYDEVLKDNTFDFLKNITRTGNLVSPNTPSIDFVQIPLYNFINVLFTSWPKSKRLPFKLVVDLWMSYIQPWMYFKDQSIEKWESFILSNWVFYSNILMSFINYTFTIFSEATTDQILMINDVLKFFTDDRILELLRIVDNYLEKQKSRSIFVKSDKINSQTEYLLDCGILTDHIASTLGSLFQYQRIFSEENASFATELSIRCQTYSMYINEKSTSEHSTWFSSKKKEIDNAINEIDKMLRKLFEIKTDHSQNMSTLKKMIKNQAKELYPETRDGMTMLSPMGVKQVREGIRKCSKFDVPYLGNDMLTPVTSQEVGFLVPPLLEISRLLNNYLDISLDDRRRRWNLRRCASKKIVFWFVITFIFVFFLFHVIFQ